MNSHEFLHYAVIYLGAALVGVTLTHALGLGSVLGYLVSGMIIGPAGLGLIRSPEAVLQFAEFGVILLLFLIGLELNPRRLWEMRRPIFGMGGAQVAVSMITLTGAGLSLGLNAPASIAAGAGLAMSSTALALQLLREKNLHQLPVGISSFAILLFQDLAVIPLLAILPLLAPISADATAMSFTERWLPLAKGTLALAAIVILGRRVVRPLFRIVARTHLREVFTAFALALVFGVASLMEAVGLSMALGTFLAGVLLAESEYRHELEVDIEPFKGLLLGLFFVAVGMSMQLSMLVDRPLPVLGSVVVLLSVKMGALYAIGRFFKHSRGESLLLALALSQGGEFAFVLFGVAGQLAIFTPDQVAQLNMSVALSMLSTPLLFKLHDKYIKPRLDARSTKLGPEHEIRAEGNPVILAGFGRIGQVIGRLLHAQGIGITILEQDPGQIETVKTFGWQTFYGDVSRLDLLRAAGAETAKLLVLAIDDMEAVQRTVVLVKEHFPQLQILVRAESRIDAYRFINQEVPVVRATFAPGLEMAEEALKLLGMPTYEARTVAQKFKRYDRVQLHKAAAHIDDIDALITMSAQNREELSRIMANDERRRGEITGDGWG